MGSDGPVPVATHTSAVLLLKRFSPAGIEIWPTSPALLGAGREGLDR